MSKGLKLGLSLLVAVALAWHVSRYLDDDSLPALRARLRPEWLLAALGVFLIYQLIRARRFQLLVGQPHLSLGGLFDTMSIQGMLNMLLPAGLGEPALVLLLRRMHGVQAHRGLASLVAARLADLLLVSVLLPVFALVSPTPLPTQVFWLMVGLVGCFPLALLALVLVLRLRHLPWLRRLSHHGDRVVFALNEIRARGVMGRALLCSAGMVLCTYGLFLCTMRALGSPLDATLVAALYLIQFPVSLLPVKGVGNVGTHHAAWFYALLILGVERGEASLLAFGSHAVFFAVICAAAGIAAVHHLLRRRT